MAKLSIILLVVSLIVMVPSLTLTVIIARRLNNQDPYNKPNENTNPMDKNFIWILGGLFLSFLIFCGAVFLYIKERNVMVGTNAKLASVTQ